jgi:hypothetical protein
VTACNSEEYITLICMLKHICIEALMYGMENIQGHFVKFGIVIGLQSSEISLF